MPGVLVVEAMAQASALLAYQSDDMQRDKKSIIFFAGIDGARFKRPVVPGDQLIIESVELRMVRGIGKYQTRVTVDGALVAEAQLLLRCGPSDRGAVHPSAIIQAGAQLAAGVEIGAYSVVGPNVVIGEGTVVAAHVVIEGRTTIGRGNRILQFASVGAIPQDKKYSGEPTALEIGDRNTIREFCTINIGTAQDTGVTRIGNDNWIMAYVHIAHDCQVGNDTTFSNSAQLAGHVNIADHHAVLGGFVGVHQFCRVGEHAMVAAGSIVLQDVPPFVTAAGYPAKPHGTNNEGLRRRGFSPDDVAVIKRAYKTLYRSQLSLDEARTRIAADAQVLRPCSSSRHSCKCRVAASSASAIDQWTRREPTRPS